MNNQQKRAVISLHGASMNQSGQLVASMLRVLGYEVSMNFEMTDKIEESINKAEVVVMLVNQHWAYSSLFHQEFIYAQNIYHKNKPLIISVMFADVDWQKHPLFSSSTSSTSTSPTDNNNMIIVQHDKENLLSGKVQDTLDSICYAALSNNSNNGEEATEHSSNNNNESDNKSNINDSSEVDYIQAVNYENGIKGVYPEINRAISIYQCSSSRGFVLSTFRLARCYEYGLGVKQSKKKAVEMYMTSSAGGLSEASFYLVQLKKKVAKKLKKLADQDDLNATYNLAYCYRYGKGGVEKDINKAIELYEICHDQNHLPSINALGEIQGRGGKEGVGREDLVKSMVLFEKASAQGFSISTFNLAYNYKIREGRKEDKEIVDMLLAKADLQDTHLGILSDLHYETMMKMGYKGSFYSKRREEFFQSKQNELDYLQGLKYEMGEQVKKDQKAAAALYAISSGNGHLKSTFRLGRCYENGVGVVQNIDQSFYYYDIASSRGLFAASFRLAKIITSERVKQYKKAAEKGDVNAIYNLAWYWYARKENTWKAKEMFHKGAKKNHLPSMHMFGLILMKSGDGYNGKSWLKKSSAKGFSPSSWCLLWTYLAACSFFVPDYQNMKVRKWGEKSELQDRYSGLLSDIDYGLIYYHGYGRLADTNKAMEYLNIGAMAMDDPAFQNYVNTYNHNKYLHRASKVLKCYSSSSSSSTTRCQ